MCCQQFSSIVLENFRKALSGSIWKLEKVTLSGDCSECSQSKLLRARSFRITDLTKALPRHGIPSS
jgi:hypothetical protein